MNRRAFLGTAAAAAVVNAQQPPIPIIDTHIHLFDPTRPEGVPWPPKTNKIIYKPALPARYREVTKGLGVVGAIEVECSPWLEDNQWVLDVSEKDPIMVGMIGDLEPGKPEFPKQLERFHKNKLYLGIRYGYLWDRDMRVELQKPAFIDGLKLLSKAGLVLDTANPSVRALGDVVTISDKVPDLRVVMDHLPRLAVPKDPKERSEYERLMRELARRPKVFVKVSEVLNEIDGKVPRELSVYRPKLDELWETFGEDRLIYGSDWPNSDPLGSYAQVLGIVQEYFHAKGRKASEKYFWRNSVAVYKWVKRAPNQPVA